MTERVPHFVRHPLAYAPLKLCLAYLATTMTIAFLGPIEYYQFPIHKTFVFMVAVMIAIYVGFSAGVHARIRTSKTICRKDVSFFENLFRVSLAVSIIALLGSIIQGIMQGTLNTDVSSIGNAYISSYAYLDDGVRNSGSYSLSFIVFTFTYPFSFIAFVMGFYYFNKMSSAEKLVFIAYVCLYILYYVVGSGKMKYLGDLMIYSIAVIAIKHGAKGRSLDWKIIFSSAVALIGGGIALLAVLGQRYAALGFTAANANVRTNALIHFDLQHPVFKLFGETTGLNMALLLSYVSQGYYGLGLGLETDWEWTKFEGFSYSISVLCNRVLGLDWVWPHTLVSQVGINWGWDDSKWHTVFTHFATDFTFPGTVVLFGWFAYIYARVWVKAITFHNPSAVLMFVMLTIGMFFMPANNQLLQAPSGLLLVIIIATIYLRYDRRLNVGAPSTMSQHSDPGDAKHIVLA